MAEKCTYINAAGAGCTRPTKDRSERYCGHHRETMLARMRSEGYLQEIPWRDWHDVVEVRAGMDMPRCWDTQTAIEQGNLEDVDVEIGRDDFAEDSGGDG